MDSEAELFDLLNRAFDAKRDGNDVEANVLARRLLDKLRERGININGGYDNKSSRD